MSASACDCGLGEIAAANDRIRLERVVRVDLHHARPRDGQDPRRRPVAARVGDHHGVWARRALEQVVETHAEQRGELRARHGRRGFDRLVLGGHRRERGLLAELLDLGVERLAGLERGRGDVASTAFG